MTQSAGVNALMFMKDLQDFEFTPFSNLRRADTFGLYGGLYGARPRSH
jgi:hypothetical protein